MIRFVNFWDRILNYFSDWNKSFKDQFRRWTSREFVVFFTVFVALLIHKLEAQDFIVFIGMFLGFLGVIKYKKIKSDVAIDGAVIKWNDLFRDMHRRWTSREFMGYFAAFVAFVLGYIGADLYMLTVGGFLGFSGIMKLRKAKPEMLNETKK